MHLECKIAKRFKHINRRKTGVIPILIRKDYFAVFSYQNRDDSCFNTAKIRSISARRHVRGARHRDRRVGRHPGSNHVEHVTSYPGDGGSENPVESGHGVPCVQVNRGDGVRGYPAGGYLRSRIHGAGERRCYRPVQRWIFRYWIAENLRM